MPSLKHSRAVSFLATQIGSAAAKLAGIVLDETGRHNLAGREETITPQIARELTARLCEEIRSRVNEREIQGVSFKVHCFKHSEEKEIGADIAGLLSIQRDAESVTKLYLAQAKIATHAVQQGRRSVAIRAGDRNLQRQCKDMLLRTPTSYVFVYSPLGVHVVPATAVQLKGKGMVDTTTDYYKSLRSFYTDLFKCFLGDTHLGSQFTTTTKTDEIFRALRIANGLSITANVR